MIPLDWPGKAVGFIKRTGLSPSRRPLFLSSARPVSLTGDRLTLRSLHQSFISSSPPACPLCAAFVINVEQLKSLTWVQAKASVSVGIPFPFLDSGHKLGDGRQRCWDAVLVGSLRERCVPCLHPIGANRSDPLCLSSAFLRLPYSLYLLGLSFCLLSGYTDERCFVMSFSIVVSSWKSFSSVN